MTIPALTLSMNPRHRSVNSRPQRKSPASGLPPMPAKASRGVWSTRPSMIDILSTTWGGRLLLRAAANSGEEIRQRIMSTLKKFRTFSPSFKDCCSSITRYVDELISPSDGPNTRMAPNSIHSSTHLLGCKQSNQNELSCWQKCQ